MNGFRVVGGTSVSVALAQHLFRPDHVAQLLQQDRAIELQRSRHLRSTETSHPRSRPFEQCVGFVEAAQFDHQGCPVAPSEGLQVDALHAGRRRQGFTVERVAPVVIARDEAHPGQVVGVAGDAYRVVVQPGLLQACAKERCRVGCGCLGADGSPS